MFSCEVVEGGGVVLTDETFIQIARKSGGSMVFIGSMSGSIVNVPQPQASVISLPLTFPFLTPHPQPQILCLPL